LNKINLIPHRTKQNKFKIIKQRADVKPKNDEIFENSEISEDQCVPLPKPLKFNIFEKYNSEFRFLFNLWRILVKLFLNKEFEKSDFCLTSLEKQLIHCLIKKKKFSNENKLEFSEKFFNELRQEPLEKKTEDCLKFIFKKTLNALKKDFKKNLSIKPNSNKDLDLKFYDFHFGNISKMLNIPIESFHHFRNWQNRDSPLIPKSITKRYISRLNLNRNFIKNFKKFLEEDFISDFKKFNLKKIRKLISNWEEILKKKGPEEGLIIIVKKIFGRGNKLPWTINEALHAKKTALERLTKD
jgi:hypothetical protein